MLGMLVVLVAVGYGLIRGFGLSVPEAVGMFAGSLSSTPGMAAVVEMVGDSTPVVGYSLAYPGAVIGAILVAALGAKVVKANHEEDARAEGMIPAELVAKAARPHARAGALQGPVPSARARRCAPAVLPGLQVQPSER